MNMSAHCVVLFLSVLLSTVLICNCLSECRASFENETATIEDGTKKVSVKFAIAMEKCPNSFLLKISMQRDREVIFLQRCNIRHRGGNPTSLVCSANCICEKDEFSHMYSVSFPLSNDSITHPAKVRLTGEFFNDGEGFSKILEVVTSTSKPFYSEERTSTGLFPITKTDPDLDQKVFSEALTSDSPASETTSAKHAITSPDAKKDQESPESAPGDKIKSGASDLHHFGYIMMGGFGGFVLIIIVLVVILFAVFIRKRGRRTIPTDQMPPTAPIPCHFRRRPNLEPEVVFRHVPAPSRGRQQLPESSAYTPLGEREHWYMELNDGLPTRNASSSSEDASGAYMPAPIPTRLPIPQPGTADEPMPPPTPPRLPIWPPVAADEPIPPPVAADEPIPPPVAADEPLSPPLNEDEPGCNAEVADATPDEDTETGREREAIQPASDSDYLHPVASTSADV